MRTVFPRVGVGLAAAALALGALELGLRLGGFEYYAPDYGSDAPAPSVFVRDGADWVTSPEFPQVPRQRFPAAKAGEWRAVLVGESTVGIMGQLRPLAGAIERLRPGARRWINFGIASYGSIRLLRHFPEILSLEPDLVVVYVGHNEYEEGLLRRISTLQARELGASLTRHLRSYQLVSKALQRAGGRLLAEHMDRLRAAQPGPRLELGQGLFEDKARVLSRYRENLRSMVRVARSAGARVVLCTAAYNRETRPDGKAAVALWEEARAVRDKPGEAARAKALFERAQDEDESPHHASETTNRIVREVAAELDVPLFDADAWVVARSREGIPGPAQFFDHCHLRLNPWMMDLQGALGEWIAAQGLAP